MGVVAVVAGVVVVVVVVVSSRQADNVETLHMRGGGGLDNDERGHIEANGRDCDRFCSMTLAPRVGEQGSNLAQAAAYLCLVCFFFFPLWSPFLNPACYRDCWEHIPDQELTETKALLSKSCNFLSPFFRCFTLPPFFSSMYLAAEENTDERQAWSVSRNRD